MFDFLNGQGFSFSLPIPFCSNCTTYLLGSGEVKRSEEEALTFKYKDSHTVHRNFGCRVLPKIYAKLGVIGHYVLRTNEVIFAKYSAEFMQICGSVTYDLKSFSLVDLFHDLYHVVTSH